MVRPRRARIVVRQSRSAARDLCAMLHAAGQLRSRAIGLEPPGLERGGEVPWRYGLSRIIAKSVSIFRLNIGADRVLLFVGARLCGNFSGEYNRINWTERRKNSFMTGRAEKKPLTRTPAFR